MKSAGGGDIGAMCKASPYILNLVWLHFPVLKHGDNDRRPDL